MDVPPARLRSLYAQLLAAYGPQGWWPLAGRAGRPGFDARGYHPADPASPDDPVGRFEVALGAVLTQNTAWPNAERALAALLHARLASRASPGRASRVRAAVPGPAEIAGCSAARLARLVRPSGSFRAKARKLRGLAAFFREAGLDAAPGRDGLLAVWGIGPETADSILLYAFQVPVFVVDAYTRRLLSRLGAAAGTEPYAELQEAFHRALGRDAALYNEYHALIVRNAKEHCRARPSCPGCPVRGCPSRAAPEAERSPLARPPRSRHNRRR